MCVCVYVAAAVDKKETQRPVTPIYVSDVTLSILLVSNLLVSE